MFKNKIINRIAEHNRFKEKNLRLLTLQIHRDFYNKTDKEKIVSLVLEELKRMDILNGDVEVVDYEFSKYRATFKTEQEIKKIKLFIGSKLEFIEIEDISKTFAKSNKNKTF